MAIEQFTITLQAQQSKTPAIIRLRRLLKMALRTFRIRCIEIKKAN